MLKTKKYSHIKNVLLVLLLLISFLHLCLNNANAEDNAITSILPISVSVERKIAILNGGYIMINDTFSFSTYEENSSIPLLSPFFVGIPIEYRENLIYYVAYDLERSLPIAIVEDEYFKWLSISLPEIKVSGERTYNFTLMIILSDLIEKRAEWTFRALFPLYPALRHEVSSCNVTVILPATISQINYPQDTFVSINIKLYNSTSPLAGYANISSWVEFYDIYFSILKILEMRRDIVVDGWGRITVTDFYEMKIINLERLSVILPHNSTNIIAYDAYGMYQRQDLLIEESLESGTMVTIFLSKDLKKCERARIAISYSLPFWKYVKRNGWQNYELSINLTKPDEWIINKITVTILLPEGASFIQENRTAPLTLTCERVGFFQDKITIKYYNVTKYASLNSLNLKYQYIVFWAAFRPTLLTIALVGLAIAFISSASRVTVKATALPLEVLREFIGVCEEKLRITSELESLKEQFAKGKVTKRQYQLTRRVLDERSSILQRRLLDLKNKVEPFGGYYARMIREMEEASVSIEEAIRGIEEVDLRYRLGKVSSEERHKLLEEYNRKKVKAKNTINEILLKLKEEIF